MMTRRRHPRPVWSRSVRSRSCTSGRVEACRPGRAPRTRPRRHVRSSGRRCSSFRLRCRHWACVPGAGHMDPGARHDGTGTGARHPRRQRMAHCRCSSGTARTNRRIQESGKWTPVLKGVPMNDRGSANVTRSIESRRSLCRRGRRVLVGLRRAGSDMTVATCCTLHRPRRDMRCGDYRRMRGVVLTFLNASRALATSG